MGMVNLVIGITFPLFSLSMKAEGFGDTFIGISAAVQGLAVFLIAPYSLRLAREFSPLNFMATLCGIMGVVFAIVPFLSNPAYWLFSRLIIGACGSLLWISASTQINQLSRNDNRGKVIGVYSFFRRPGLRTRPFNTDIYWQQWPHPVFIYLSGVVCCLNIPRIVST